MDSTLQGRVLGGKTRSIQRSYSKSNFTLNWIILVVSTLILMNGVIGNLEKYRELLW